MAYWLKSIIICGLLAVFSSGLHIKVVPSAKQIQPGGTISISCEYTDLTAGPGSTLSFIKRVKDPLTDEVTQYQISAADTLLSVFNIPRYRVVIDPVSDTEVTSLLTITDMVIADGGEIGCEFSNPQMQSVVPITVLTGLDIIQYENNEEVNLDEGSSFLLTCSVTGSSPNLDVKISLGNEDITDRFTKELTATGERANGLDEILYTVSRIAEALQVDASFAGQQIMCESMESGVPTQPRLSDAISIKMSVKPNIQCVPAEASKGATSFRLECTVSSDPPLTGLRWTFGEGDGALTVRNDESTDQLRASSMTGNSPGQTIYTLTITEVHCNMFGDYEISATNALGATTGIITLTEKKPEDGETQCPKTGKSTDVSRSPHLLAGLTTIILPLSISFYH